MAKKESTAVAEVTTNFDLVTGYEGMDEDTRAELEDEMDDFDDGGTIARMIRIPAGGGKNFQVETEDPDDPERYMNYYNRYDAGFRGMTATAIANRNVFSQLEDAEKTERGIPLEPINYG